jgi:hypothetical protein
MNKRGFKGGSCEERGRAGKEQGRIGREQDLGKGASWPVPRMGMSLIVSSEGERGG